MANYILNAIGPSGPGGCYADYHWAIDPEVACHLNDCCITNPIGSLTDGSFYNFTQVLSPDGFTLCNISTSCPNPYPQFCNYRCIQFGPTACDGISEFYTYVPYGAKIRMEFYVSGYENNQRAFFCDSAFYVDVEGANPANLGSLSTRGDCLNGWFNEVGAYACEAYRDQDYGVRALSSLTGPFGYPPLYSYRAYFNTYAFDSLAYNCDSSHYCCNTYTCDGQAQEGTVVPATYPDAGPCDFECRYSANSCFNEPYYDSAQLTPGSIKECGGYFDYECDVPCGVKITVANYLPRVGFAGECLTFIPGDKFTVDITCEKQCPT